MSWCEPHTARNGTLERPESLHVALDLFPPRGKGLWKVAHRIRARVRARFAVHHVPFGVAAAAEHGHDMRVREHRAGHRGAPPAIDVDHRESRRRWVRPHRLPEPRQVRRVIVREEDRFRIDRRVQDHAPRGARVERSEPRPRGQDGLDRTHAAVQPVVQHHLVAADERELPRRPRHDAVDAARERRRQVPRGERERVSRVHGPVGPIVADVLRAAEEVRFVGIHPLPVHGGIDPRRERRRQVPVRGERALVVDRVGRPVVRA